ncbi:hypothetical protein SAMN04487899_101313 [Segatella bryantii]|nr:hypothetical protein SAMN04487899_101313 [Segatella bryantii]
MTRFLDLNQPNCFKYLKNLVIQKTFSNFGNRK